MSNKKDNKHVPVSAINAVDKQVKRERRQEKEKQEGHRVVTWIFGALVFLAVVYMVWTVFVVS